MTTIDLTKVKDEQEKPIAVCFRCYMPLTRKQIAATILEGTMIEWEERKPGTIKDAHLCADCRDTTKKILEGGVRAAVKRQAELDFANTFVPQDPYPEKEFGESAGV
jgi:hypothetical protein